jgi:hypothetical protein
LIAGSYDVVISAKGISHFKNKNARIEYWITTESVLVTAFDYFYITGDCEPGESNVVPSRISDTHKVADCILPETLKDHISGICQ